ncbi:hypothetical protein [Agrilactobacillus fermenti]|uniref:hypothetical protein n=1 Tax=Agrilactobacillus fermenti TaxID=2586909 RepID=UPI001E2E031D|nr:hypothetical protein [Agrilactobacillus fermenti]
MDRKVQIDPDKFALAIAGTVSDGPDDVRVSKNALLRYLTAYYLVLQFNELEADQFSFKNSANFKHMIEGLDRIVPH